MIVRRQEVEGDRDIVDKCGAQHCVDVQWVSMGELPVSEKDRPVEEIGLDHLPHHFVGIRRTREEFHGHARFQYDLAPCLMASRMVAGGLFGGV